MTYEKRRFTDEEIERVNSISIFNYAVSKGLELKRVGTNSYKIEKHGGLHINPMENKWNCFSERKGGGIIQFIMFMENKTWVESIKQLLGITSTKTSYKQINTSKIKEGEKKGDLILPEKNNTYKHMIAYLIQTRKIDKDIVYKLIKEEKLYEDKNRNCVFIGHDKNNNAKYASLRGTNINTPFRGDIKNSDKSYPFHIEGISNKVYVCEAPIETIVFVN